MRRMRAASAVAVLALMVAPMANANPDPLGPPVYEGGVVQQLPAGSCGPESQYDLNNSKRYGENCRRMRIVFGPIVTKPGQNDVLIQPVTIEKPMYDGYMVRFKPNLVTVDPRSTVNNAQLAVSPPVEDVHLHHGTWLDASIATSRRPPAIDQETWERSTGFRGYGYGPWLASGEEKTVVAWPNRYGLRIQANDKWLFLHMVHNATPRPMTTWVTYDVDYVDAAYAESLHADGKPNIQNTTSLWLDVMSSSFHPEVEDYSFNPIYNSQKGFGSPDPEYGGQLSCSWPDNNCARFNAHGSDYDNSVSAQQGLDVSDVVDGWDYRIPDGFFDANGDATLLLMGGHLHNGGLRDEVEVIRCYQDGAQVDCPRLNGNLSAVDKAKAEAEGISVVNKLIHVSDAYYWNDADGTKVGAPPVSWDFVMTGVTADLGWKVHVRKGDILRLNSIYDATVASWYENMGIVMTWGVKGVVDGAIDPFAPNVQVSRALPAELYTASPELTGTVFAGLPRIPEVAAGWPSLAGYEASPANRCSNGDPDGDGTIQLCARGQITHAFDPAARNHNEVCPFGCTNLRSPDANLKDGPLMNEIQMGGFTYGQADISAVRNVGIPRFRVGEPVTWWNLDTADYMWHTVTRCAEATCADGITTASHPIPNGGRGRDDLMDFDSGELGIGIAPNQNVSWTFTPTEEGVFTFYCRIHPSMRGAFKVVPANVTA